MRQLTAEGNSWYVRPPVGDTPVRWRERWAGPVGLPLVPRVPLWLAMVVIAGFVLWTQWCALTTGKVFGITEFRPEVAPYSGAVRMLEGPGLAIGLLVVLTAVRATASVPWERDKNTWEGLLLTPLDSSEVLHQKAAGIVDSALPCHIAVLLASLPGALACGVECLVLLVMGWSVGWALLRFVAAFGLEQSIASSNRWWCAGRTLMATWFILSAGPMAGVFVAWLIGALLWLVEFIQSPVPPAPYQGPTWGQVAPGGWIGALAVLLALQPFLLLQGGRAIDELDRTQPDPEGTQQ
jgi:hypothetical protein